MHIPQRRMLPFKRPGHKGSCSSLSTFLKDKRSTLFIMIFWFILILISGGGSSIARQSSQKNNPVYDLDLSSKIHLKWQIDYENDEVIFEVAFLDKNHQGIL